MSEHTPLLNALATPAPEEEVSTKERLGRRLESSTAHWIVIFLTSLDACFVLCDIGYDFLKDQRCICTDSCPEDPQILEVFSLFSLFITSLFLIEIPLSLYSFGTKHYTSVDQSINTRVSRTRTSGQRPAPRRNLEVLKSLSLLLSQLNTNNSSSKLYYTMDTPTPPHVQAPLYPTTRPELPPETWLKILGDLHYHDLKRMAATSKHFTALVKVSFAASYAFQWKR
ncbi:hypothetical protein P7C70_g8400, partial [Phenoliferia sp. Uapishka_3]